MMMMISLFTAVVLNVAIWENVLCRLCILYLHFNVDVATFKENL